MAASGDLRDAPADTFWQRLQDAMGRDGLLTYRYLGRITEDMHAAPYSGMAIRRDMRNARGGLMAAPLAIATAETGFTDFDAVPAPVTAGLTMLDDGIGVSEIRMHREVIRTGRTLGFSRTVVTDAADERRVIAVTRGIGIKLGEVPADGGGTPFPLPDGIADRPDLRPLTAVFGGERDADGRWLLPPMRAGSRSTSGSLHLGPIHIVLEAAATDLAEACAPEAPLQIEGWDVMFVAAGLVGPFVARGRAMAGGAGRVACDMTLTDQGRGDRVVATATALFGHRS